MLVQADPEAYLLPGPGLRLVRALASRPDLAVALPGLERGRRGGGPRRAAVRLPDADAPVGGRGLRRGLRPDRCGPAASPSSPVFAVRRSALEALPARAPAARRARARRRGGAWPRRSIREPTCTATEPWTPPPARISRRRCRPGPARFSTWVARAERPRRRCGRAASGGIVGIEPDAEDAAAAARVYDEVLAVRLEDVRATTSRADSTRSSSATFSSTSRIPPTPSCACGRGSSERGVVVASVPNVGPLVDRGRPDPRPLRLRALLDPLGDARPLLHPLDAARPLRGLGLSRDFDRDAEPAGLAAGGEAPRSSRAVSRREPRPRRHGVHRGRRSPLRGHDRARTLSDSQPSTFPRLSSLQR